MKPKIPDQYFGTSNSTLDNRVVDLLICSENSLIAADNLRAALVDLAESQAVLEEFLALVRPNPATSTKDSSL
jgi:hypothetical protein